VRTLNWQLIVGEALPAYYQKDMAAKNASPPPGAPQGLRVKPQSPRPPSPTHSVMSVKTTASAKTTMSRFEAPDVTIDEVREYIERPHHSWGSALSEFARIETSVQMSKDRRRRLEDMSDTGSCMSGVSAYTVRSSVSAPGRPAKGRMAMLPLGARATTAEGPRPAGAMDAGPLSPTGSEFSLHGASVTGVSTRTSRQGGVGAGVVVGPAGGLSGPKRVAAAGGVMRGSTTTKSASASFSGSQTNGGLELGLGVTPLRSTPVHPPAPQAGGGAKFTFTSTAGAPAAAGFGPTTSAPAFVPKLKSRVK
jgi:hypothetical protein